METGQFDLLGEGQPGGSEVQAKKRLIPTIHNDKFLAKRNQIRSEKDQDSKADLNNILGDFDSSQQKRERNQRLFNLTPNSWVQSTSKGPTVSPQPCFDLLDEIEIGPNGEIIMKNKGLPRPVDSSAEGQVTPEPQEQVPESQPQPTVNKSPLESQTAYEQSKYVETAVSTSIQRQKETLARREPLPAPREQAPDLSSPALEFFRTKPSVEVIK